MSVRVGKIPNRFGEGDKTHPRIPGYENINVTSASRSIFLNLSPMKLGPFTIIEPINGNVEHGYKDLQNGYQSADINIFENYWQGSKIFKEDLIDGDHITLGNLKASFFQRRIKMYNDPKPHRRALPKTHGYPIAGYYYGNIYDYVPSRTFYVYYYKALVEQTEAYKKLQDMYRSGKNLHIIGYDGRDIGPITKESILQAYNDKTEIFGHELVLAAMLTDTLP